MFSQKTENKIWLKLVSIVVVLALLFGNAPTTWALKPRATGTNKPSGERPAAWEPGYSTRSQHTIANNHIEFMGGGERDEYLERAVVFKDNFTAQGHGIKIHTVKGLYRLTGAIVHPGINRGIVYVDEDAIYPEGKLRIEEGAKQDLTHEVAEAIENRRWAIELYPFKKTTSRLTALATDNEKIAAYTRWLDDPNNAKESRGILINIHQQVSKEYPAATKNYILEPSNDFSDLKEFDQRTVFLAFLPALLGKIYSLQEAEGIKDNERKFFDIHNYLDYKFWLVDFNDVSEKGLSDATENLIMFMREMSPNLKRAMYDYFLTVYGAVQERAITELKALKEEGNFEGLLKDITVKALFEEAQRRRNSVQQRVVHDLIEADPALLETELAKIISGTTASRGAADGYNSEKDWDSDIVAVADLNPDMFRDYDYRYTGREILKPELVYRFGLVWADLALKKAAAAGITGNRKVLLARDARKVEPELIDALTASLRQAGLDVIYISADGPNSVTHYSWAVQEYKPLMSIFVTASHVSRPKIEIVRGFKVAMLNAKGAGLQSLTTREIKETTKSAVISLLEDPQKVQLLKSAEQGALTAANIDENCVRFNALIGQMAFRGNSLYNLAREMESADSPLEVLEAHEKSSGSIRPLKGMKVAVEGAHTPSGKLARDIFYRLGADTVLINGDIQEIEGEHNADPSKDDNLAQLKEAIERESADFGIAFDLDGDRGAIVVPVRIGGAKTKFLTLAPDNLITALLPYLAEKLGYNLDAAGNKIAVIRDVLATFGINDMSQRLGIETYQTDAGYVFLKARREQLLRDGYVVPIYGERSGHSWLDVTGEIENPMAMAAIFAVMVKNEKYKNDATDSKNPFFETYSEKVISYNQSPRFQPLFHPEFLAQLSADKRNTTGWQYAPDSGNPPQAIIALGKDTAIKALANEFSVGEVYDTLSGQLKVREFNTYQDAEDEGGLYRFADIVFELDGEFSGRFVFRASSNDPSFVCSYETPVGNEYDRIIEDRMSSIGGLVLDWLEEHKFALVAKRNIQEQLEISAAQADKLFKDANLGTAEGHLNAYRSIINRQIIKLAQVLDKTPAQAAAQMIKSIDKAELLANFAETTGISEDDTIANMIHAGLVADGWNKENYILSPDFYALEKLNKFIVLQIGLSSNPEDADTGFIRMERIILDAINPDTFIANARMADTLIANGIFADIAKLWKVNRALEREVRRKSKKNVKITDIIRPEAGKFYQQSSVNVRFNLPGTAAVSQTFLSAVLDYQAEVEKDLARGEFNYRGTGTKLTVEDFYNRFKDRQYGRIREFTGDKVRTIISNGIGANDQFAWEEVEMYKRNKPEGAPEFYHVATARDLVKLLMEHPEIDPQTTVFIDISRSGGTWEGVEVMMRSLAKGFRKRIVLANGGAFKAIADLDEVDSLVIKMSPDIGGRNMHRKTPIYYTIQTILGKFLPQMDSGEFAKWNHVFDAANDFGSQDSLALNSGKFIHSAMKLFGVDHIALITNSVQLGLTGTEFDQYIMEGLNKKDVLDVGKHDLTRDGELQALSALAKSPSAAQTVGIALLDKAQPDYAKHKAAIAELQKSILLMVIEINTGSDQDFNGINVRQQSAIDILWTDTVAVLAKLLRVDANSNPNVKVVRGMTKTYVADWRGVAQRYSADPIGMGKTDLMVNIAYPSASEFSVESQMNIYDEDSARVAARSIAGRLADEKLLSGRNRLNLFSGTDELMGLAYSLRNHAYGTDLAGKYGWIPDAPIFKTDVYPNRAHKGHEATLAPLASQKNINIFLNARELDDNEAYNAPFKNVLSDNDYPDYAKVNGATVHQTNDSMTFPNIQRTAQVSPTMLFEFNRATPEIQKKISAFYEAFVEELIKQESVLRIAESDSIVHRATPGFDGIISPLKNLPGVRGGLVIGADVLLENAGFISALKEMKGLNKDYKIAVVAKDVKEISQLDSKGIEGAADIVTTRLSNAFSMLSSSSEQASVAALVNPDEDIGDIAGLERRYNITLNVLPVAKADLEAGKINVAALILARVLAEQFISNEQIQAGYLKFIDNNIRGKVSDDDFDRLANLTMPLDIAPLVTENREEILKAQAIYAGQI